MNHVGDFRNIDFCVIGEYMNKVVQFSQKKRQSLVNKYCLNQLIENPPRASFQNVISKLRLNF